MIRIFGPLIVVLAVMVAAGARADQGCAGLSDAIEALIADQDQPRSVLDGEHCVTSRTMTGGRALSCFWEFPFRALGASAFQDNLLRKIETCFNDARKQVDDQPVNHPDTYSQQAYHAQDAILSVSVKDKTGQNRTLVVLTIAQLPRDR